jgi:hypothetical protein
LLRGKQHIPLSFHRLDLKPPLECD